MNKLIILCNEGQLDQIRDLIDKNFPDKDIQVYTDIEDVPEDVRDMVISNGDRRVDMHFNDKNEFRKTVDHLMKELSEDQRISIEEHVNKIAQQYQDQMDANMAESLKQVAEKYLTPVVEDTASQIKAEKERRKKDQKQQNKYALKYANKHYKK